MKRVSMGKLITIEGIDASGKETQSKLLFKNLKDMGKVVRLVSYPNYESASSALVKMYLAGELAEKAEEIDAYQASVLFAVDRFASFKKEWQEFYQNGGIVIADRYTTANMIHQGGKIFEQEKRSQFLDWLENFEYNLMALPRPDLTLFLDVSPEISHKLSQQRAKEKNQIEDIHEKDFQHLTNSYLATKQVVSAYDWQKIDCVSGENLKSIEEIQTEILSFVLELLE